MAYPFTGTSLEPPETFEKIIAAQPERSDLTDEPSSVFRHTGWAPQRKRIYESFQRLDLGIDRLWNFTQCGKHAYVLRHPTEPDVYRISGSTCHDRFCLPCANSRSHTIAMNVIDNNHASQTRLITLTLHSHTEPLAQLLSHLSISFSKLRQRSQWKKRVTGGVAFLEIKWNAHLSRWNVHLHILASGKYYKTGLLSALWLEITGNSKIVDLAFVHDRKHAARYITKYASKPLDPTVIAVPDRLDEAIVALKGRRLCTTFGTWRGIKLTDSPSEESWDYVDTLSSVIEKARRADADSLRICECLGVPVVLGPRIPRAPPRAEPILCVNLFDGQETFDRSWSQARNLQWD